jgi:hypothetical protein
VIPKLQEAKTLVEPLEELGRELQADALAETFRR